MKMVLLDHHIAVSVLSVIDLGLLTLTINEGVFRKPITLVDINNVKIMEQRIGK